MSELEIQTLTMEEFEAVRLIDAESMPQKEAAALMKISQPTISRILKSARKKITSAIVTGKALHIQGGDYQLKFTGFGCQECDHEWSIEPDSNYAPEQCPKCDADDVFSLRRE